MMHVRYQMSGEKRERDQTATDQTLVTAFHACLLPFYSPVYIYLLLLLLLFSALILTGFVISPKTVPHPAFLVFYFICTNAFLSYVP